MRTNADFTKWIKTVSDKRLKQLIHFIWLEGKRRGWSDYWME